MHDDSPEDLALDLHFNAIDRERASAPILPTREDVIAYLRSLPEGGFAELIAEAKIAEWVKSRLYCASCPGGSDDIGRICRTGGTWEAEFGDASRIPPSYESEVAAREWVEAKATAEGWHISRRETT